MNSLLTFLILLLFQDAPTSTDEGVPYTPNEGPGWILIGVAVITIIIVAFVVVKVFKGIQRSRNLERIAEDSNSQKTKSN